MTTINRAWRGNDPDSSVSFDTRPDVRVGVGLARDGVGRAWEARAWTAWIPATSGGGAEDREPRRPARGRHEERGERSDDEPFAHRRVLADLGGAAQCLD